MKQQNAQMMAILAILGMTVLACATAANIIATPTPLPTSTPTFTPTPASTPTKTVTPTPSYTVELGRPVTARSGGFTVSRVDGYNVYSTISLVHLTSKDENVLVRLGSLPPLGTGPAAYARLYLENIQESYANFESTELAKETKGDVSIAWAEFSGKSDGKPVHGRIDVYEPQGSKVVVLIVMAFGDQRWEREGQTVYEKVSGSLQFQPIKVWEACPIAARPEYGTTTARPIQIGGGLTDGESRIDNYLDALLGPHGEFVTYRRAGTKEGQGVTLEEYTLYYGSIKRTLYFDIYSFKEIFAPTGMQCSAPLPLAPVQ